LGSPTVTKRAIVHQISQELGVTQLQTRDVVQRTLDAIIEALVSEGRIELRDFGVFEVRRRATRKARNPRTGEKVITPARNVVAFKPGREMGERVVVAGGGAGPHADREFATDRPEPGRSPSSSPRRKKQASGRPV
jgi:integration host factor subunit beta